MKLRRPFVIKSFVIAIWAVLAATTAACGSENAATPSNDMRVVAGDRDAVEPDGTITLTSSERTTCSRFIIQAGKVHRNMTSMAETSESGSGWQSYTAGMPGWLQQLELERRSSSTPAFAASLQSIADAGAGALAAVTAGRAPEQADYDAPQLVAGLTAAATLCESAGINISWHA